MTEDFFLSLFSYLFIIWFILVIVLQIYYSTRGRKEKSKKLLYAALILSILASLSLTVYTAFYQNNLTPVYLMTSFILNFILWIIPVVIAFVIHLIYFKTKRYEFKEVTKEDRKEERMANRLKKHNEEHNKEK